MRRFLSAACVIGMLGLGGPVAAEPQAIKSTIAGQVDAFLNDDLDRAFGFAAPSIKRLFGNSANFGRMVREGYPMVWRPAEMTFGKLRIAEGKTIQTVFFTDAAGRVFEAAYEMVETGAGWQINGVYIREADLGA